MGDKNLIIPLYLNQKIVFDFIAVIEDGIAKIQTIQRKEKTANESQAEIEGEIGTSNILSFLKINLKSNLSGNKADESERGITEEKIHTPTSLFSKLLDYLHEKKLINDIKSTSDINKNLVGNFIHFKGTLEKNPIISFIESFEKGMNIANIFQTDNRNQGNQGHGKKGNNKDSNKIVFEQIKLLSESLKSGKIIDMICKLKDINIETVLQTNIDYFNNKSMNELIDGEFNIIGKVIKITNTEEEKINLLRNTSLSIMGKHIIDMLSANFDSAEIEQSGLVFPKLKTEINGNSMLIIPIAIYI